VHNKQILFVKSSSADSAANGFDKLQLFFKAIDLRSLQIRNGSSIPNGAQHWKNISHIPV
jgi:hypothetical protein